MYYTLSDAAKAVKYTRQGIFLMVKRGDVPHTNTEQWNEPRILFSESQLKKLMKKLNNDKEDK